MIHVLPRLSRGAMVWMWMMILYAIFHKNLSIAVALPQPPLLPSTCQFYLTCVLFPFIPMTHAPLIEQILHTLGTVAWDQPHYIVEQVKPSVSGKPTSAFITSGNGGEYRKTRHGFAPGYAIVLDSPTEVQLDPMQIDTWNRDKMDISGNKTYPGAVKFVPGQSLIYPPPPF